MTKPITPQQAKEAASPVNKRAHLKKLVTRRLNRELKKGLRHVKVPNDIAPALAGEIADEFRALGWTVVLRDLHNDIVSDAGNHYRMPGVGGMCWRYDFAETRS